MGCRSASNADWISVVVMPLLAARSTLQSRTRRLICWLPVSPGQTGLLPLRCFEQRAFEPMRYVAFAGVTCTEDAGPAPQKCRRAAFKNRPQRIDRATPDGRRPLGPGARTAGSEALAHPYWMHRG